jgi:hypothetical protein
MYLQAFALLENKLDGVIERALDLGMLQSNILAKNFDFRKKIVIARVLANLRQLDPKLIKKSLGSLHEQANERNMVAHDYFTPSDDEKGVKFLTVAAKERLEYPDVTWTVKETEDKIHNFLRLIDSLDELAEKILPPKQESISENKMNEAILAILRDEPLNAEKK